MKKELSTLSVRQNDPFFTADKWNQTLNYTQNFEQMLKKLLGDSFKGIYKPFQSYELFDRIWYDGDFYEITDEYSDESKTIDIENYKNAFYYNNDFIALNQNNKITRIKQNHKYTLSEKEFETFYLYGDKIIALNNQSLYKLDIKTNVLTPVNFIFDRNVKDIKMDAFQIYILFNNSIEVGETLNDGTTQTKEIFSCEEQIIDISFNESNLFILKDDNKINVINKSTGELIKEFSLNFYCDLNKVKIISTDLNSFFVYNGETHLAPFYFNGSDYIHSAQDNKLVGDINSLTFNEGKIVCTNNNIIQLINSTRYNLEKLDVNNLLGKSNLTEKKDEIKEFLDFSKGQYETEHLVPKFTALESINNIGVSLKNELIYGLSANELFEKTICLILESSNESKQQLCELRFLKQKIDLDINQKGKLIIFLSFDKDKCKKVTYNGKTKTIEYLKYVTVADSKDEIKFVASDEHPSILNQLIIFKNILTATNVEFFSKNNIMSFDIQASTKSYPFSYVKTDENGNISINVSDDSILKTDKGYHINFSDNFEDDKKDIGLNLKGANTLKQKITTLLTNTGSKFQNSLDDFVKKMKESLNLESKNREKEDLNLKDEINKVREIAERPQPYLKLSGGTVNGKVTITEGLEANNIKSNKNCEVNGDINSKNIYVSNNMEIGKDTNIKNNLNVDKLINAENISSKNAMNIGTNLYVGNDANFNNNINIAGKTNLNQMSAKEANIKNTTTDNLNSKKINTDTLYVGSYKIYIG